jgi:hypothetical protein
VVENFHRKPFDVRRFSIFEGQAFAKMKSSGFMAAVVFQKSTSRHVASPTTRPRSLLA